MGPTPWDRFPWWRGEQKQRDALTTELDAALVREETLRRENDELLQHRGLLAQEFEQRLGNGLQMIASLLTLQSQTATPDAARQLAIAARRVVALGRVHQRLHLLDHQERVEFKGYLQHPCDDLSGLLFQEGPGHAIVVEGTKWAIEVSRIEEASRPAKICRLMSATAETHFHRHPHNVSGPKAELSSPEG